MDKYIGKILDNRYEILEQIGMGGMAVVYKARCHRLNRLVAVKILKDEFAKDKEFRERFHAEGKAIAMTNHPNIVLVHDVSRSNTMEYIVMELIDGITLKQYMERRGRLSIKETLHFIMQICSALDHAHSLGIIHRDIKPQNVMLLRDGTIKVTDFGIARQQNAALTVTNEALGTVHYIAPEQARASKIDHRVDIYSLGVVMYEMLTGRLPFDGDDPVAIAVQHVNATPLMPRDINFDIPEALETITMRAMSARLADRYGSAREMLDDLEKYKNDPQIVIEYEKAPVNPEEEEGTIVVPNELVKGGGFAVKFPALSGVLTAIVFIIGAVALIATLLGIGGGKNEVRAPDLVGKLYESVKVSSKDFTIIEQAKESSDEYKAGEIISQKPNPGRSVKLHSEILVVVSSGPKTINMPDISQMTEKQVRIELVNKYNLKLNVTYEPSDTVLKDYVISSTPPAGTSIGAEDEVNVVISAGKNVEEMSVPNFIGMTVSEATREAEKYGITIDTDKTDYSNEKKGVVIAQSVAKNEKITKDKTVYLTISKGPKEEEPDTTEQPKNPEESTTKPDQTTTTKPENTQKSVSIPVSIPTSPEKSTVVIKVGGTVVYSKTHNANEGVITISIKGSGTQTVGIYINGELTNEATVNFG